MEKRFSAFDWPEPETDGTDAPVARDETRFPCTRCGGMLTYAIGTDAMECRYCGHNNPIVDSEEQIHELDLPSGLQRLDSARKLGATETVLKCPNCAAEFSMAATLHASDCPFCGTAVVTSTGDVQEFSPQALLPFSITETQAREAYRKWISGRWFAPGKLKKFAREDNGLNGIYIPYWTYDSDTVTAYSGQRGDTYYVQQSFTVVENGRRVRRTRMVPKIRWTPVQGRTDRHFDDVLIGATRTLPRKITDWLQPWDLENLVPYTEDYLAGFQSEVYQVALDEGFGYAKKVMLSIIRDDVRRHIGGDHQQIHHVHTQHDDTTFKHVLLPLWSAAFEFRGKPYRFVVNGRNGKIRGERPYSVVKIAFAVIAGAVALGGMVYVMEPVMLERSSTSGQIIFPSDSYRNFDPFPDFSR